MLKAFMAHNWFFYYLHWLALVCLLVSKEGYTQTAQLIFTKFCGRWHMGWGRND